jgi:glycosyltransferase involved in cell wall biosynthesis
LQLPTREGFEVKVSEALHKGVAVIATNAGGIPMQVQDGKNGNLVETGNVDAVARNLHKLSTDNDLYDKMSEFASTSVSDEVSTVGNAVSSLYLAVGMIRGEGIKPNGKWINDIARNQAGEPYEEGEKRLPRYLST